MAKPKLERVYGLIEKKLFLKIENLKDLEKINYATKVGNSSVQDKIICCLKEV